MSTTITFRRGTAAPTQGAGLTLGEPAFDTTNRNLYVGLGSGVTAAWVGARISGLSTDIAAGLTNWIANAKAIADYVTATAVTPSNVVTSFNGLTGAVGGVCAAQANTFTALQTFNAGLSASSVYVSSGSTFNGLITVINPVGVGISANDARFRVISGIASLGAVNAGGIELYPSTLNTSATATLNFYSHDSVGDADYFLTLRPVTDFTTNRTVTFADESGTIALRGANTFTGLQSLTSGLSAAGGITFNGPLTGVTATFSRLVTGNAGFSGALTGTATNASSLGGTAAASWALLASPTFTGTPAAPTAPVGTNTTQLATTAFVQNEIVADTVTSVNGATGAITNVVRTNLANTFTALQTFNSGITASAVYVSTGSTFAGSVSFTGGLSAAGTITLASPNLTGTPTATTAAIGTNTTQLATTAFVQNEIVADTVTSVNGATGAITNVVRTNLANTFSSQQIFTAGISAGGGVTADTMNVLGNLLVGATLTVSGNFVVNGTTTTINSTTISVDDKNIVLGDTISPAPSDTTADDGGITLRGTTDKTLVWKQTTAGGNVGSAWNSNQDFNLTSASGAYWVNGSQVLSKTTLGSTVVSSSLTSVGTITSGTWNSDIVYVDGGSY